MSNKCRCKFVCQWQRNRKDIREKSKHIIIEIFEENKFSIKTIITCDLFFLFNWSNKSCLFVCCCCSGPHGQDNRVNIVFCLLWWFFYFGLNIVSGIKDKDIYFEPASGSQKLIILIAPLLHSTVNYHSCTFHSKQVVLSTWKFRFSLFEMKTLPPLSSNLLWMWQMCQNKFDVLNVLEYLHSLKWFCWLFLNMRQIRK